MAPRPRARPGCIIPAFKQAAHALAPCAPARLTPTTPFSNTPTHTPAPLGFIIPTFKKAAYTPEPQEVDERTRARFERADKRAERRRVKRF